jgi:hypothetical protein
VLAQRRREFGSAPRRMRREDELGTHRHHGRPGFAACRRSFTTAAAAGRRRLPSISMVMQAARRDR